MAATSPSSEVQSHENSFKAIWRWLTRNGTVEPDGTAPQVEVSGVADVNLDNADDDVLVYGKEDGSGTNRAVNTDSSGRVRVDGSAVTQPVSGTVTANAGTGTRNVQGSVAHDDSDSGNPVKVGGRAVAHGSTPTAVAAGDRTDLLTNRQGIPFVMAGVPNVQTVRANYTTAQTNAAIVTVGAGTKIVVTKVSAQTDEACTVGVQVRIGFATATTPTTTGVVLSHPGLVPGGAPVFEGNGSGIIGVGADDEDLRITSEVPTGGSLDVVVSYYTVSS